MKLTDSVREILGNELELLDPAVTVEHLLTHTSGIGDYLDEGELSDIHDYILSAPVHELATPSDGSSTVMSNTSTGAWPLVKALDELLPQLVS